MKMTSTTSIRLTHWDALFAIGRAVAYRTLAFGVLSGDSGEFQVLVYQLGIAHYPGYPVYLLIAKVFTLLPLGEMLTGSIYFRS